MDKPSRENKAGSNAALPSEARDVRLIKLSDIYPDPLRKPGKYDDSELCVIARGFLRHGIGFPITAAEIPELKNKFMLISGISASLAGASRIGRSAGKAVRRPDPRKRFGRCLSAAEKQNSDKGSPFFLQLRLSRGRFDEAKRNSRIVRNTGRRRANRSDHHRTQISSYIAYGRNVPRGTAAQTKRNVPRGTFFFLSRSSVICFSRFYLTLSRRGDIIFTLPENAKEQRLWRK